MLALKSFISIIIKPLIYITLISCGACSSGDKKITQQDNNQQPAKKHSSSFSQHWDHYDFNDTSLIQNPDKAEQHLVDFISSFPNHSIQEVDSGIQNMLQRAEVNPIVFSFFNEKYAHYLYDPNSPMYNEWYYEPVLRQLLASALTTDTDKIRFKMQLDMVRKNQPGSIITDFQYLTSYGEKEKLQSTNGLTRLVIFYDPACPHCKEIIGELKSSEVLNSLIAQKQIEVLAIDPTGDKSRWKEYQKAIPINWKNGFDDQEKILKQQLYHIAAYPTIYLIDSNNIIILKDPNYQHVLNLLKQQTTR